MVSTLAGVFAVMILAPSAFAETDSVRFEFGENGTWTVPDRVSEIEVEVAGAGGGGNSAPGGNGALVRAAIEVSAGMTFDVGVGGGGESTFAQQSGGGGASIVESGDILIIAGGGGGATSWAGDADGGNAGHDSSTGAGQNGGITNKRSGGKGGAGGIGGTGAVAAGAGEDYDPSRGLYGTGGQRGSGAIVGGAGGEARDERYGNYGEKASPPLGGGGGAGYGGGSSGFDAFSSVSNFRGGGGAGGSIAQGTSVSMVEGASSYYSSDGGAGGSGQRSPGTNGWVVITWVIPPALPADESDEVADAEPIEITLAMPAGLSCSAPQAQASGGWVRLPAGNDCTGGSSARSSGAGDEPGLLGWATTSDFPVSIAQRQVDEGWGAYELTDDSGSLEAVFIPGGGWTRISGDTNLFPIWAE